MHRYLFSSPAAVDWATLAVELAASVPGFVAVNRVESQVAVYTDQQLNSGDQLAASVTVADHAGPPPYPPLDSTGALATLLVVEGVLPLVDAANAIREEQAHLVHEAEAWGVG
jgi:hypothetical protein